jgi:hypothetical protein
MKRIFCCFSLIFLCACPLSSEKQIFEQRLIHPREFLVQQRDESAAQILYRIFEELNDFRLRSNLSDYYNKKGFITLSSFLSSTLEYIKTGIVPKRKQPQHMKWFCEEPKSVEVRLENATRIQHLVDAGLYGKAISESEEMLSSDSASCLILVEWSRATLLHSIGQPLTLKDISSAELALRWMLTSAEELNVFPLGTEGLPGMYDFLAGYFSMKGDYISAYVSASFAAEELRKSPEWRRELLSDRVIKTLKNLKPYAETQRKSIQPKSNSKLDLPLTVNALYYSHMGRR